MMHNFILLICLVGMSIPTALASEVTKIFCESTEEQYCEIEKEIFSLLTDEKSFGDLNHKFELYVDNIYESNMTLREFLSSSYLTQVIEINESDKSLGVSQNKVLLNEKHPGTITTLDHPLTCDRDVDFNCEAWNANRETFELVSRLRNMPPISVTLSQQYINGNVTAMQFIVNAIMYHPAAKVTVYITKLGQTVVAVKISESVAGASASYFLGAAAAGLIDLEAGDILTFDGKGNITKTSSGGTSSGGGGGSGGGSGSGSGSVGGSITVPGGSFGGTVILACTGNKDRLVCKPMIV